MTLFAGYSDRHRGEEIMGECPRCRLPIYVSDPRRMVTRPAAISADVYHTACADGLEADYYERELMAIVERLRGLRYVIDLRLTRPVR